MKLRSIEDINNETLTAKLEDSIFLRVIDYGLAYPDGFTYNQITGDLKLEGWERKIIDEYIESARRNATANGGTRGVAETPFFLVEQGPSWGYRDDGHRYIISFDAHFKFIDYHELKFARENAKEAKELSRKAIAISVSAAIVSIIMPVLVAQYFVQNVTIDPSQWQSLLDAVRSAPPSP